MQPTAQLPSVTEGGGELETRRSCHSRNEGHGDGRLLVQPPGASQEIGSFRLSAPAAVGPCAMRLGRSRVMWSVLGWRVACRLAWGGSKRPKLAASFQPGPTTPANSSNCSKHPTLPSHITHPHCLRHRIPFEEHTETHSSLPACTFISTP